MGLYLIIGRPETSRDGLLLPDAEAAKNFTQQIVARELAGDCPESLMGKAQLFSEEFPVRFLLSCVGKVLARDRKRPQVTLARKKNRLTARGPSGRAQDGLPQ